MCYVVTEIQDNGARTTICWHDSKEAAVADAAAFYYSEGRRLRYVVDEIAEAPSFGKSADVLRTVWDSLEILPWE